MNKPHIGIGSKLSSKSPVFDKKVIKKMQKIIQENKILETKNQREKIYTDLLKIADDGEFEDMRREIIRYFNK